MPLRPVPVLATWQPPSAFVTFSHAITPGSIDPANWFVRVGNFARSIATATVLSNRTIVLSAIGLGPDPGPDIVSYSPPPFDVTSPWDPVAPFAGFPIT